MNLTGLMLKDWCAKKGYTIYTTSTRSWSGRTEYRYYVDIQLDAVNGGKYVLEFDTQASDVRGIAHFCDSYSSYSGNKCVALQVATVSDVQLTEIQQGEWTYGYTITTPTMRKSIADANKNFDDLLEVIVDYETRKRKAKKADMRSEIRNEGMEDLSSKIQSLFAEANIKAEKVNYEIIKSRSCEFPFQYRLEDDSKNMACGIMGSKRHDRFQVWIKSYATGDYKETKVYSLDEAKEYAKQIVHLLVESAELHARIYKLNDTVNKVTKATNKKFNDKKLKDKQEREAKRKAKAAKES